MTGAPQGITSANYPGRVPPGSECFWHITAEKRETIIHIEFIAFKMAKNCKYHYVKLYSSADCRPENLTKGNEIATLCGAKRSKQRWNYFSDSTGMCVVMVTDKNTASSGFKAYYQSVKHNVDKQAVSSTKKKGRSHMQPVEYGQELPKSIGKDYWTIGG